MERLSQGMPAEEPMGGNLRDWRGPRPGNWPEPLTVPQGLWRLWILRSQKHRLFVRYAFAENRGGLCSGVTCFNLAVLRLLP